MGQEMLSYFVGLDVRGVCYVFYLMTFTFIHVSFQKVIASSSMTCKSKKILHISSYTHFTTFTLLATYSWYFQFNFSTFQPLNFSTYVRTWGCHVAFQIRLLSDIFDGMQICKQDMSGPHTAVFKSGGQY